MTRDDVDAVIEVFTPDGTYSAFGDTYPLADFPTLVAAAPKGLFLVGPPVLELDGDTGSGQQPLCFVDQTTHDMRIGYYTDTYRRTADGWRLHTRAMTFLRKSGARDSGRAHDPTRPRPVAPVTGGDGRGRRHSPSSGRSLDAWLDANADALAAGYEGTGHARPADGPAGQGQAAGLRCRVDALRVAASGSAGSAGSTLTRAYLGEALTARDLVEPGLYSMTEVLAPTMIDYAAPELAAAMVPALLRGDETWCQGFSEPGTGSNLAALACRAERTDGGWRVTGQKVWTSLAQYAHRCVLLTRTGTPESAHRGITALFVDMDSPGITVRPIGTMHGSAEFSELFFDDVVVPFARTLGEEGGGWAVAMDLLPYERSTSLWHRAAFLHRRLQELLEAAPPGALDPARLGEVTQLLYAFRARSRATQHRMAERRPPRSGDVDRQGAAGHGRTGGVRPGRRRPGPRRDHGGRPGERTVAHRVPLLAGRLHLRRQRRDPAQHHRPPPPRPRGRSVMDAEDLALFERSLATPPTAPPASPSTPHSTGWGGATRWPTTAGPPSPLLFELQGRTGTTSSALGQVMAHALGLAAVGTAGAEAVLPDAGGCDPPGHGRRGPAPGRRPGRRRSRPTGRRPWSWPRTGQRAAPCSRCRRPRSNCARWRASTPTWACSG